MSTSSKRRVCSVYLMDQDPGLDPEFSLVHSFENVIVEGSNEDAIRELIMNNGVKELLDKHNSRRGTLVNLDILNRTGNQAALQPIRLNGLTWVFN